MTLQNEAVLTEITRTYRLEAAHRLPHVPADHKCARLHGHSFQVTLCVRGPVDAELGWIVDFAALDEAWQPMHRALDHRYLNEIAGLENPTSEHLARWIAERVRLEGARLHSVTVHENCVSSCTVYPGAQGEPSSVSG